VTYSLTGLTIAILFIGIVVVGFTGLYVSMATSYGVEVPDEYQNMFYEFEEAQALIIQTEQTVGEGQINEDAQDIAIFKAAITAGKQIRNSAKIAMSMLTDSAKLFSVPMAIIGGILAIIIFATSMAFLAFVMRGRAP
jgi:hypothetical protein